MRGQSCRVAAPTLNIGTGSIAALQSREIYLSHASFAANFLMHVRFTTSCLASLLESYSLHKSHVLFARPLSEWHRRGLLRRHNHRSDFALLSIERFEQSRIQTHLRLNRDNNFILDDFLLRSSHWLRLINTVRLLFLLELLLL